MSMTELTTFFGWCTIINFSLLIISSLMLFALQEQIATIHSKLTGIQAESLRSMYFNYLGNYKILIIVFNVVPYIVLRIMV
jgi:hypothetical protein